MRKLVFTVAGVICAFICLSQAPSQPQPAVIDSFKKELSKDISPRKRFELLGVLCRTLMTINIPESDKYGQQLIEVAELSRDRKWMTQALLINGERYANLSGRKDNIDKAISYYEQGLELARQNKLDEEMIRAYLSLSEVSRYIPDPDRALGYCNQAYSYASVLKSDSLTAKVHFEYGMVFQAKSQKLLALRNYMAGLRIAEELKNPTLLRIGYNRLSIFYAGIEDYDKAIDYLTKSFQKLDEIKTGQTPYNRVQDLVRIGDLYAQKKNHEMAMHFYERSLQAADSIRYEPIKALGYRSIVTNYLAADQPRKALDYFNAHPQLKYFLESMNFGHFVDQSYGFIYIQLEKYDSALYYYQKIAPFFERGVSTGNMLSYYSQLGMLHRKMGAIDKSIGYYNKAKAIADEIGQLEQMKAVAVQLDSLYQAKGDFKQAFHYASLHHRYQDSLATLGKEKDIMQVEVADEQQRQERIQRELLEKKQKRDNIQYLLITIGIAGLFVVMVMMGMFKVSATTIKMVGFFTFLMFFEFIFLIFKKNIYGITHGEPWRDLLFMILLAAILLPLHHWLEHRVIHYLTSHNRLTSSGKGLINKVLGRKKAGAK
jgi:tetratricopeptide (TPR) repeat protein